MAANGLLEVLLKAVPRGGTSKMEMLDAGIHGRREMAEASVNSTRLGRVDLWRGLRLLA